MQQQQQSSQFLQLAPYHILSYGTLLGVQVFQTFIGGIVSFKVLPRPQFAALQTALFKIYFRLQTVLPAVVALTYPGVNAVLGARESGLAGVFLEKNRWGVLAPLAVVFLGGLANLVYIGPATTATMRERKHQETRDGKKSYDPPPHSDEMRRLNKKFGQLHGVSSLVNVASVVATIVYGFHLAKEFS